MGGGRDGTAECLLHLSPRVSRRRAGPGPGPGGVEVMVPSHKPWLDASDAHCVFFASLHWDPPPGAYARNPKTYTLNPNPKS